MLPGVRVLSGQLLAVALSLPLPVRLAAGVRVYGRGAGGCLLTVGGGERGADRCPVLPPVSGALWWSSGGDVSA